MPIYEYRCASCGFQSEYLQKVSDPPRSVCPECGKATFNKLLTAAGFQLKGSGWYATDFKGKGSARAKTPEGGDSRPAGAGDTKDSGKDSGRDSGKDSGKDSATSGATPSPASS